MESDDLQQLRRQSRVIAMLSAAERAGNSPLPAADLHLLAYFADALSPVWGLKIVDGQRLKSEEGPFSSALQEDIDLLVARRVVLASHVRHVEDPSGWRIDALYGLNDDFKSRILEVVERFPEQRSQLEYVREVVFAVSGLGIRGMAAASASDASYGDPVVSNGFMVDISTNKGVLNATAEVALRFGELLRPQTELAPAEMIHLYVRELYGRLRDA